MRRKGLGTTNFFETGAFLKTRDDVDFPNMQYEFLPLTRRLVNNKLIPVPGFQFWMDLSRPESRGAVTLRSSDPAVPPSIVFNHYESRQDMRDMVDGIKLTREIVSQLAWRNIVRASSPPGPTSPATGRSRLSSASRPTPRIIRRAHAGWGPTLTRSSTRRAA